MELRNGDGSRAEMSGNGIRCFAQAVWNAGLSTGRELVVATDAGIKAVRRMSSPDANQLMAAVDMGPMKVVDAPDWVGGSVEAAALVDAGNQHLVLLDSTVGSVPVSSRGPEIEATFAGGINVEWIWSGPGADELTMRVWERGAGETLACGTGACASAVAALGWGKVGASSVVHNPGGDVTVHVGETTTLTGPAVLIAAVELPWP
jgi:diaminopimelate epimerase